MARLVPACASCLPNSRLAAAKIYHSEQHDVPQIMHLRADGKCRLFTDLDELADLRWWLKSRHVTTVRGSAVCVSVLTLAADRGKPVSAHPAAC